MAKSLGKVYLGYEDETINEKNTSTLNYTVNKIGGLPDWPPLENLQFSSKCPICGLYRLLALQCYAPIENSVYHRTLYLFACINPNCWNQSESWSCIRSQFEDRSASQQTMITVEMPKGEMQLAWCAGAEDWDENDNGDSANGNIMSVDNAPGSRNCMPRNSDEEDDSNSYEMENVEQALGNMQVFDAHNANMSPVQGAVGAIGVPVANAELEGGDEPGLVTVDTPTAPTNDIQALLNQTAELPIDIRNCLTMGPLQFVPKFIYVDLEWKKQPVNDEKVTELLNRYRKDNADIEASPGDKIGGSGGLEDEQYEDGAPLHGDRLFHAFVSRLRKNPGQILRYSRGEPPLLGAPLPSAPCSPESPHASLCPRCGSKLICELQLVPEFAESLCLLPNKTKLSHLHFLSVLIFTCLQSCWQPGDTFVNETVVIQPEVV